MKNIVRFVAPLSCLLMLSINSAVFSITGDEEPPSSFSSRLAPQHLTPGHREFIISAHNHAINTRSLKSRMDATAAFLKKFGFSATKGQIDYALGPWAVEHGVEVLHLNFP